jgi:chromosome segregation ATPase
MPLRTANNRSCPSPQDSELKPLRDAYDATHSALHVERQMASESAQKVHKLEDECEALRQRLTHLSTLQEISSVNMQGELEDAHAALASAHEQLEGMAAERYLEQQQEASLAADTQVALENGLFYRDQVEQLSKLLDGVTTERDQSSAESARLSSLMQKLSSRLNEQETSSKSAKSLLHHMTRAMAASMKASAQFDHTYLHFRKKAHKLRHAKRAPYNP